jgi:CHAD domain-containing protein
MNIATEKNMRSLGEYAYQAIEKHWHKTVKWEKAVKKDEDPEALHQMRVGMRRLRTAISRFNPAVNLPKSSSDKNISKIANHLGCLRDLDVLKETLENIYLPQLTVKEKKILKKVIKNLQEQRKEAVKVVDEILKHDHYLSLKESLNNWLETPTYKPLASLDIFQVLPDLLLPEVSIFLLHPAWMSGTEIIDSKIQVINQLDSKQVELFLKRDEENLHSLRKQTKRLRYQMELFSELYGESYGSHLAETKRIQEILGSLQDSSVLIQWLKNLFETDFEIDFEVQLPTLLQILRENRYQLWQEWQTLQMRYLQQETRQGLHLTILHPLSETR